MTKRDILRRTGGLLSLALPVALVGCASGTFSYSEVTGQRFFTTNLNTFPVNISRVDGRSVLVGEPLTRVDAGVRVIEVQGPPNLTNPGDFKNITIDVKVCTRYYIVAFKPNRLESAFTPQIDYEMPVPGCTPPAGSK
ncbi:MAG TPA: hypothetical protein PL196_01415 [Burkholderiaceae bacterium]|nr:hypothetical protein [Burkholderiaceae bacterium]